MKRLLVVFIGLVIGPFVSFAGRPLSTDDSGTIEKGKVEMKYGLDYINNTDNELAVNLTFTIGLSNI